MSSSHLRWLFPLAGLGALLLCLRCVRSGSPGLDSAYPVSPVDEAAPDSATTRPVSAGPPEGALGPPTEPAISTLPEDAGQPRLELPDAQLASARDGGANPVARLMRTTDSHDRELLSEVERATGTTPSRAIIDLVQRRHAGAAPAELQQLIETQLAGDVRERMAAQRWLRAVFPAAAPAAAPSSPAPGAGGGTPHLSPIERKPR